MKNNRIYLLLGIVLLVALLLGLTFAAAAQTPAGQPVDETLGLPPIAGSPSRGVQVPAGNTLALLDDFNRADGPLGPNWTLTSGYCNVTNNAAACGDFGGSTFNGAPGDGSFAEADIAVVGTDLQYTGLMLNYGGGVSNIYIKVQQQDPYPGQFTHGACYLGYTGGGGSFGLGFFSLTSFFSTAHMAVERVGNTVTIYFTNVDGGGQPDQTYVCDGAPAPEGTGIGINGYNGIALLDNFGGPGPAAPTIFVDPPELHEFLAPDMQATQTLSICNTGDLPLDWEIHEAPASLRATGALPDVQPQPQPEIMRLPDGSVDCAAYQDYAGYEPAEVAAACPASLPAQVTSSPNAPTDIGYAQDIGYISDNFVSFTLNNFSGQTVIGTNAIPYYGMDFDPAAEVLYALNDTTDMLGTIDLTTGAFTPLVSCPPGGGAANWTGLSIDPVTGVFYGSTATSLFIIDPATGVSTLVGNFGTTLMIDIAINMDGQMYGHDIGTDAIYSIDTATGVATLIGPTGYLANFAQGMDFDNDDGTLYIFLYVGSGANVYGTVNLATGAVTPLSVDSPLGEFEGATQTAAYDIPWLSENPLLGTTQPGECVPVDVTFDSTGLAFGDYFGNLVIVSNDPATPQLSVPVTLTVVPLVTWDKYIDGQPWAPDMSITVQTSDTILVEEVLNLVGGAPAGAPGALQGGLLYLTSLDIGDLTFAVYDPTTDAWTPLAPYETGCQMAVSENGQLLAHNYAANTIDVYDPASDTWSTFLAGPPDVSGGYCNLEITNAGELLYTQYNATNVWYTSGGVWNTLPLPFTTNAMGDYDPSTDQYVIGEIATTNAHMVDVHTWAITDYSSPVGNGEYARFSVVMDDRYYWHASDSNIHYFELSNPADPPVDTTLPGGWYNSAAGDRLHHLIYNVTLDSLELSLFDTLANSLTPLTGYGISAWHSSVAYVPTSVELPPAFAQIEYWDPAHLQLVDWAATGGEVIVDPDGSLIWSGQIVEPGTLTLTKWFHVEPSTWTDSVLLEELWVDDIELEERPVNIVKLAPELWIEAQYNPQAYAGQPATFTLEYGNLGGYENEVLIRNEFPPEAPFSSSDPAPTLQDPGGLWAEWEVGDLAMGAEGSISVWVDIQPGVPSPTVVEIWDGIYNHLDELADEVLIGFEILPTVDLSVSKDAPAEVFVGETFTYTLVVTNLGVDTSIGGLLTDTLPVSVTYVSDDGGCLHASGVLTCSLPDLAMDESVTIHILVTADAPGTVSNAAEVWAAEYESDLENNLDSADTLINEVIVVEYFYFVPLVYKH